MSERDETPSVAIEAAKALLLVITAVAAAVAITAVLGAIFRAGAC